MRALEIAALLEMLQVAANRRERDADRLRQFLDRGRPALADMLQHEGPALRGNELGAASWDHAILSGREFRTRWIAGMRRCFSARAAARFWQKMAVYGGCQQLNAGSGASAWYGVELAACAAGRDVRSDRSVWIFLARDLSAAKMP